MEDIHTGYVLLSLSLIVVATLIASIPSGPKCPKCEGHLTQEIYGTGIKKINQQKVSVYFVACHRCRNKFNIKINTVDRPDFNDLET